MENSKELTAKQPSAKEIERSIIKTFAKPIWRRFVKGINDYEMIVNGDRIAVCISGGKDSMLLAKCMQELKKHNRVDFELEFITMDPGYNALNRRGIEENAKWLDVPLKIFDAPVYDVVEHLGGAPCYICARMRRGKLYAKARELGCNKIALAHHFDDVIETTLMSMMYGEEIKTMMPKIHSLNFSGMQLIRPLYLVREESILAWKRHNSLEFINCACRFVENCSSGGGSKRGEMKELIKYLRALSPAIEQNIFKSMKNVDVGAVIEYKKDGRRFNFLDNF